MAEVEVGAAAPVAPVTNEQPAPVAEEQKTEATPEAPGEPVVETTEQVEAKKQSKFQRRLERQKTARIQAETRAEIAEKRIAELEAQGKPQQGSDEPKREQFEDYETYLRAVAKYDAKQETASTLKADRESREGKEQQGKQREVSQRVAKEWNDRETSFQKATKDYADVVAPYVEEELSSLSLQARHAIVESDVGPALLYHLASHPDVAERIADLSPSRQIAELGKLEEKIPVAKRTTNAPAPISPVSGGKTSSKDVSKMTQKEYEAHRKAQGARWAQ